MRPWYLGNTTVRSPFRLRDGLIALANSMLGGNIKGREKEIEFARVLHNAGVVNIVRPDADVSDLGRKWRAALSQLGFIYPEIPAREKILQSEVGVPFTITPNGRRLIETITVSGMQECFLRSLAAYYIPSPLERKYKYRIFSPLRHTLSVLLELEKRTGESRLNFLEMGLFVQLTSTDIPVESLVDQILKYRAERDATTNKRKYDQAGLESAAVEHKYVAGTFRDYADTNFRYLKATGLVQSKGRGIAIVPEKRIYIEKLVLDTQLPENDQVFLKNLCEGAALPTDNRDTALIVLDDLVAQANRRGISYSRAGRIVRTPADIEIIRHEVEDILSRLNEEEYATRQAQEWKEIATYMELLTNLRHRRASGDDVVITIPQAEAPAYFEWVLWRAFLAIDSLVNRPYEARRFKIDQDYLPVGTAPGGNSDLIFEFEDYVVVVEVTLTESSRQEGVEGEPVRRHVADEVARYSNLNKKPIYGLFIANKIDNNTAETFRRGDWYNRENKLMRLDIIPLTLTQFKNLFEAMFVSGNIRVSDIQELLKTCSDSRSNLHALDWKADIEKNVQQKAACLRGSC